MLARLSEDDGVQTAEVDRRGELLRVRLRSAEFVDQVIDRLGELGFAGEVLVESPHDVGRWYGPSGVAELSREEAQVIARRVVPAFARRHDIGPIGGERLITVVADALHACFVARPIDANASTRELHHSCGRAVDDASRPSLGPGRAAALGQAVEADLQSKAGK